MFGYIIIKRKTIHELHDHVYNNGEFVDESNSNEIPHWDKYGIISAEIYD